jgi:hypothetical protein
MLKIKSLITTVFILLFFFAGYDLSEGDQFMNDSSIKGSTKFVFASFAETGNQLQNIYYMAESIREFAGGFKDAKIIVYVPEYIDIPLGSIEKKFASLGVKVRVSSAPEDALWFYFAGKVYAAALAEKEADGSTDILIWMDEDTIVLQEPEAFILDRNIGLAYRPVMHNRSGILYGEPPNEFWARIYDVLKVKTESLFPMVTPADKQEINAYFNAGLLVVRPELGILRKWADDFTLLYNDSVLADMCRKNVDKRIFLHQTALVGAVLNTLEQENILELSEKYNYPIFFDQMYGAVGTFKSIDDIITMRYDVYFRNPAPDWSEKLQGSDTVITWLKARLGKTD